MRFENGQRLLAEAEGEDHSQMSSIGLATTLSISNTDLMRNITPWPNVVLVLVVNGEFCVASGPYRYRCWLLICHIALAASSISLFGKTRGMRTPVCDSFWVTYCSRSAHVSCPDGGANVW